MRRLPTRLFSLVLLLTAALLAGCDSGGADVEAFEGATVQFASSGVGATPSDSLVTVPITIQNPQGSAVNVEVLFAAQASTVSDTAFGENVVQPVTFPASAEDGATQTVTFDISDVDISEGPVAAYFALQQAQSEAPVEIGATSEFALSIGATPIAEARSAPEGTTVTIAGIVTTVGDDEARVQDETAGIIITRREDFAASVAPGDRVRITGAVSSFANQKQIDSDDLGSYEVISSGNELPPVQTLSSLAQLGDAYESERVRIEGVTISPDGGDDDSSPDGTFKAGGAQGNYTITDSEGITRILRIPGNSYYQYSVQLSICGFRVQPAILPIRTTC